MDEVALLIDENEKMMPEYIEDEDEQMIGLHPQTGSIDLTPTKDKNTSSQNTTTLSAVGTKWLPTPVSGSVENPINPTLSRGGLQGKKLVDISSTVANKTKDRRPIILSVFAQLEDLEAADDDSKQFQYSIYLGIAIVFVLLVLAFLVECVRRKYITSEDGERSTLCNDCIARDNDIEQLEYENYKKKGGGTFDFEFFNRDNVEEVQSANSSSRQRLSDEDTKKRFEDSKKTLYKSPRQREGAPSEEKKSANRTIESHNNMDESEQSIKIPNKNLQAMRKQLHAKEERNAMIETKQIVSRKGTGESQILSSRQLSQPDQLEDSNMDPPAMPNSDDQMEGGEFEEMIVINKQNHVSI